MATLGLSGLFELQEKPEAWGRDDAYIKKNLGEGLTVFSSVWWQLL